MNGWFQACKNYNFCASSLKNNLDPKKVWAYEPLSISHSSANHFWFFSFSMLQWATANIIMHQK